MRKAEFLSGLRMQDTIHPRYVQLLDPLGFYSAILREEVWIPPPFVCDKESVPVIQGTSIRGGFFHDYLSRYDSIPCIGKFLAADVYREVMEVRDAEIIAYFGYDWPKRLDMATRREVKHTVVRWWPGYFHRFPVAATLEQILRVNG